MRPVIFAFQFLKRRIPSTTTSVSVIKRRCCHCSGRVQAEGTADAWLSQALVKPPVPAVVVTRSLSSSHRQQLQGPDLWQATNKGVFKN